MSLSCHSSGIPWLAPQPRHNFLPCNGNPPSTSRSREHFPGIFEATQPEWASDLGKDLPSKNHLQITIPPPPPLPPLGQKPTLACHFYKRNPKTHHRCARYKLTRIKDVTQHLQRQHLLRNHLSHAQLHAIAELKKHHLHHLPSSHQNPRSNHIQDHWLGIWRILFPGVPRPRSVYLEGHVAEVLGQLRDYWAQHHVTLAMEARRLYCGKIMYGPQVEEEGQDADFNLPDGKDSGSDMVGFLSEFVDVFLVRFAADVSGGAGGDSETDSPLSLTPAARDNVTPSDTLLAAARPEGGSGVLAVVAGADSSPDVPSGGFVNDMSSSSGVDPFFGWDENSSFYTLSSH